MRDIGAFLPRLRPTLGIRRDGLFGEWDVAGDGQAAAREARSHQRKIACGPSGADRDALAAAYRREHKLAGVPPGSIVRPRLS